MSPTFLRGRWSRDPNEVTEEIADGDFDVEDDEDRPGLKLVEASSVAFSDPDDDERVWIGWVRSSLRDTLLVEMIDERSADEMPAEVHGSTAIDSAYVTFSTRMVRHDGAWVTFEAPVDVARSNRRGLFRVPVALPIEVHPGPGVTIEGGADPARRSTTLDIGHGGIRALLPRPLRRGESVELAVTLDRGAVIRPVAEATWSVAQGDRYVVGLQFSSISNGDNKALSRAIGHLQRRLVPRVESTLTGSYRRPGSPTSRSVSIVELSPGAVTVVAVERVDLGTGVALLFFVTGDRFSLDGTVVEEHSEGERHRMVVALDPLEADIESALRTAIADLGQDKPPLGSASPARRPPR